MLPISFFRNLAGITIILSLVSINSIVQAEPFVEPTVMMTQATERENSISSYAISASTSDGGSVNVTFVWQMGVVWKWPWMGKEIGRIFDTPLTLQMSKFSQNGSLEFAVTYSPLYLIQYKDTNGNGLLDLKATRISMEEISSGDVDWARAERPLRTYPLTPVFNFIDFERGVEPRVWRWAIGPLNNKTTTIKDVNTYEFSWNASATVPTYTWSFEEGYPQIIKTTVNATFGFNLILDPDDPQIKYDFNLSDISWTEGNNVKLALLSAIQYHSQEPVAVRADSQSYDFEKTWTFEPHRFTISESATDTVKAFVTYTTEAVVDGSLQPDAVKTSLQPLFLIPTFAEVPKGVHVRGMTPGFSTRTSWRQYIAFSHQLGLPRFNESISQDPIIGMPASLLIGSLGALPPALLTPQTLVIVTIIVTMAFATYWLKSRKRFPNPQRVFLFNSLFANSDNVHLRRTQ